MTSSVLPFNNSVSRYPYFDGSNWYNHIMLTPNQVNTIFETSIDEFSELFGVKSFERPQLDLLENRVAMNTLKGEKTADWVVATYSNSTISVLTPTNYESESDHKYSDEHYEALIKHEVTHFFYEHLTGNYKPLWLSEGIAVYFSGQCRWKKKPSSFETFLKYHKDGGEGLYHESGHAIKILVDRFGVGKLLSFVRQLRMNNGQEQVKAAFEDVYGVPLSFQTFNEYLQNSS